MTTFIHHLVVRELTRSLQVFLFNTCLPLLSQCTQLNEVQDHSETHAVRLALCFAHFSGIPKPIHPFHSRTKQELIALYCFRIAGIWKVCSKYMMMVLKRKHKVNPSESQYLDKLCNVFPLTSTIYCKINCRTCL